MPHSQNATFRGAEPEKAGLHNRGASIVRMLRTRLSTESWSVGEIDDWRDSGYYLPIDRDGQSLQLVLSPFHADQDRWILQLAPARRPSMVLRWFGAVPSASPETVYKIAVDVQQILTESGFFDTLWCWDDLADHSDCTPSPLPASAA